MRIPSRPGPWVLLLSLLVAGCGGDTEDRTEELSPELAKQQRERLSPVVRARLDSGNTAFRTGEYGRALEHYRRAVNYDSSVAAAWFGLFMAQRAVGDSAAADSVLARARALSGNSSLLHPGEGDTVP